LVSRKEEAELVREFDKEYVDYKKKVPMLIPKWSSSRSKKAANQRERLEVLQSRPN
jgi:hypothetical protein